MFVRRAFRGQGLSRALIRRSGGGGPACRHPDPPAGVRPSAGGGTSTLSLGGVQPTFRATASTWTVPTVSACRNRFRREASSTGGAGPRASGTAVDPADRNTRREFAGLLALLPFGLARPRARGRVRRGRRRRARIRRDGADAGRRPPRHRHLSPRAERPAGGRRPSRHPRAYAVRQDRHEPFRAHRPPVPSRRARAEVAAFFVRHGYVVVYQDCRGRYTLRRRVHEVPERRPTTATTRCAWIVRAAVVQRHGSAPWASRTPRTPRGRSPAPAPPGLAAMFLDSGGFSNAYQGGIRQGGAFELKQATWAFNSALESPEIAARPARSSRRCAAVDIKAWFRSMPWKRGDSPVTLAPEYEDYLFEQWEHGDFDDYWKQLGHLRRGFYDQFTPMCAMVHMSSWYDPYPRTATDNYLGLSRRKRGPVRLILGPWTHGDRSAHLRRRRGFRPRGHARRQPRRRLPRAPARAGSTAGSRAATNGVDREPPVRLFVMGGGSGRQDAGRDGWSTAGAGAPSRTGRSPARGSRPTTCTPTALLAPAKPARRDASAQYQLRPAASGADASAARSRRAQPVMVGRRLRPARGAGVLRLAASRTGRSPRGPTCSCSRRRRSSEDVEVTGPIAVQPLDLHPMRPTPTSPPS